MFRRKKERLIVLGIDGVPYSFLKKGIEDGIFPNIKKIIDENTGLKRYNSVYPTVSSVAWTSYMTGVNPGEHNIFGFVDRTCDPFRLKIPLGNDRTSKTLWRKMSDAGMKVFVMNVPLTYPPEDINGVLISGFLTPDINKGVFPSSYSSYLNKRNYVIDVDPRLGHTDRRKFMDLLYRALDIRMEVFHDIKKRDDYDLVQCHIMETDRINHFFWGDYKDNGEYRNDFIGFYEKLDGWIGKTYSLLSKNDKFLVLSDHGFCKVKYNVQLNHFLENKGYLKYEVENPDDVTSLSTESKVYSLIPGRVFINLKGREEKGSVNIEEYNPLREKIMEEILELRSPEGEKIIKNVFAREDIYSGSNLENSADIIVHPRWGYDLKAHVNTGKLCFEPEAIDGMHTYEDAAIFGSGINLDNIESIMDPLREILNDNWNIS